MEQIQDRDYFYKRAKQSGDEDAWNIAKHLRNVTNANIRKAKRDFVLNELVLIVKNYGVQLKQWFQTTREVQSRTLC